MNFETEHFDNEGSQPMALAICSDERYFDLLKEVDRARGSERDPIGAPSDFKVMDRHLVDLVHEVASWAVAEAGGGELSLSYEIKTVPDRETGGSMSADEFEWDCSLDSLRLGRILSAAVLVAEEVDERMKGTSARRRDLASTAY